VKRNQYLQYTHCVQRTSPDLAGRVLAMVRASGTYTQRHLATTTSRLNSSQLANPLATTLTSPSSFMRLE
jgi:hypothetical protein